MFSISNSSVYICIIAKQQQALKISVSLGNYNFCRVPNLNSKNVSWLAFPPTRKAGEITYTDNITKFLHQPNFYYTYLAAKQVCSKMYSLLHLLFAEIIGIRIWNRYGIRILFFNFIIFLSNEVSMLKQKVLTTDIILILYDSYFFILNLYKQIKLK